MDVFDAVENYFLHGKYLEEYTKSEKANLRRKCRYNFKIEAGTLEASERNRVCPLQL